jgi:signal recognition particle subunit SRP54
MLSSIITKHFKKKLDGLTIKEEDIAEVLREIRIALLDADVNLLVVKNLIKSIKEKAVGQMVQPGQDPQAIFLTIVKDELTNILGQHDAPITTNKTFINVMMVGLQGSGKTTTCAKLANWYQQKHQKKVLLVAIDVYRPAAIEQLQTLAKEINVECFARGTQDPVVTADEAYTYAKQNGFNVVIYDTAGRLQTNQALMDELKHVRNKINPDEIIMVVDAMSGQNIIDVATTFNQALTLSGFIITKLDGDARAGAALSLTALLNVPIKLVGTGERIGSIDQFHPSRMAERILGLGDILTLAEKARDVVDEGQMKKIFTRMLSGKINLDDLLVLITQMKKMGPMNMIMGMMPGALQQKVSGANLEEAEKKIDNYTILMNSMTLLERRNPALFKKEPNRKMRVIKGSGKKPEDFNKLLNEWERMRDQMAEMGKMIRAGKNPLAGMM